MDSSAVGRGKALGLAELQVDRMARAMQWWDGKTVDDSRVLEAGLDPGSPVIRRLLYLVRELIGFPRHLSQHVGGFVISNGPMSELVPIENAAMEDRTVIPWDKDDIDTLGILKVDVLALDDVLTRLAEMDERMAQVVELRVFAGMTVAEAAFALQAQSQADTFVIDVRVDVVPLIRRAIIPEKPHLVGRPSGPRDRRGLCRKHSADFFHLRCQHQ